MCSRAQTVMNGNQLVTSQQVQASTLTYFSTCPFGQLTKKSTCPTQSFSCPKKINKNYKIQRINIQGSHCFQIRERSDFSFRELTGRSGETSGRSQLRLIEILFRDPSDITLPKFSKQLKLPELICSGFFLFITTLRTTLRTYIQCHIFISVYLDWSLAYQ